MLISAEFALIFWRRGKKKEARFYIGLIVLCFVMTIFYFIAGSPNQAVRLTIELFTTSES
jgi:hypothetical protein